MHDTKIVAMTQPFVEGVHTPNELMAYVARVSNPTNQLNHGTAEKLLNYCIRHNHWSVFETVNVVLEVNTTRDIGRQILRHRSFNFQEFCVEENTIITTKHGRVPIKDLYKRQQSQQYSDMSDWLVKVYDQHSKIFVYKRIKEVFKTGLKNVYNVMLENGKQLLCTSDHKLLTFDGFKPVGELTDDSFVACNGVLLYQKKEWLTSAKRFAIESKTGLQGIAELAGVKPGTITKWLRFHNLQFSKKEVAQYCSVWNKGLAKELQPHYNKFVSLQLRDKMRRSSRKGKDSSLYSSGNYCHDTINWRQKVASWCKGYHLELLQRQQYRCAISGIPIDITNSEVDHILPVYSRPDLAFDKDNLQILSKIDHQIKSRQESIDSRQTIRYAKVKSIECVGERETYDLEIDHVDHNYIANGIVTHNSQRYQDVTTLGSFEVREARLQDANNRQNSIDTDNPGLQNQWNDIQQEVANYSLQAYTWAINEGIAKEQARAVLPEGLTPTRMYMNGTVRSWYTYIQLRLGNGTQKEHRLVAQSAYDNLVVHFPFFKTIVERNV